MAETKLAEAVLSRGGELGIVSPTYPRFNAIVYSLDVFLPFVDFGFKYHWMPNTSHRQIAVLRIPETQWLRSSAITLTMGGVLYALYVLEMVVGLVLTSLAVTAFTGLLRGTEDPR